MNRFLYILLFGILFNTSIYALEYVSDYNITGATGSGSSTTDCSSMAEQSLISFPILYSSTSYHEGLSDVGRPPFFTSYDGYQTRLDKFIPSCAFNSVLGKYQFTEYYVTEYKVKWTVENCPFELEDNGQGKCKPPITYPELISINSNIPDLPDVTAYYYSNGERQICSTDLGVCSTYNRNGERINNIPIDGVLYATMENIQMSRHLTVAGLTLAVIGGSVAVVGGTLASALGGTLLSAEMIATLGTGSMVSGLFGLGESLLGYTPYNSNNLENDNVESTQKTIKINLDNFDFSKSSEDVEHSVDANSNEVITTKNSNNEKVTITTKPEFIEVETVFNNGEIETITIPKETLTAPVKSNDFTEQNNLDDFDYEVIIKQPDKINNDGTFSNGGSTTTLNNYNSSNSEINNFSTTNEGSTTTDDARDSSNSANSTTTNADNTQSTTNQDFTPITNRLSQIINQNTLANKTAIEAKSVSKAQLENVIKNTSDINEEIKKSNTELAVISANANQQTTDLKGVVNNTSKIVENQERMLDGEGEESGENISYMISGYSSEYNTFRNNILSDYNKLNDQVEGIKGSLETGFINNLPNGAVNSCPYNGTINFGFAVVPVNIDICKVLAPLYSVLYFVFYVVFFCSFLQMSFNILINSRSN